MSDSVFPSSESKPKPCFSHLPWNVKQRIVDKTDLCTRFTTRKVCKDLRRHVDRSSFHYKRIFFEMLRTKVRLVIDGLYEKREISYEKNLDQDPEDGEFVKRALKDLAILLKSPRVTMATLELFTYFTVSHPNLRNHYDQQIFRNTFKEEFDKLNHKLHTELLDMCISEEEEIMFILPYLKPGALFEIDLLVCTSERLNRVCETDQWKQAKRLIIAGAECLPMLALCYSEHTDYRHGTVSLDDLKQLIQIILESSDRPMDITAGDLSYNAQEFEEYVQQFEQRTTDPRDRFVPIPNTELFLRIKLGKRKVFLKKLSREEMQNLD